VTAKQRPEDDRKIRGAPTDLQLLRRFVSQRDEGAFAALVERHGPMVLRVCRQLLRQPADAEDAFQAVFLVLVRRAGEIRQAELLGNWLYGVAHRVAARLRAREARRRSREAQGSAMAEAETDSPETEPDLQPLLHQEVDQLPEKYRAPVVLCYLEGKTNEQAAQALHCPLGTVKVRLARARALLRSRLTRRGLALSATLLAAALAQNRAAAAPPPRLARTTVREALRFQPEGGGATPGRPVRLARAVLRDHGGRRRVWVVGAAGLGLILLLVVAAVLLFRPRTPTPADERRPAGEQQTEAAPPPGDAEKIQGRWRGHLMRARGMDAAPDGIPDFWIFHPDGTVTVRFPNGEAKKVAYRLDPTKKPRELDIEGVMLAVYELNEKGDVLMICFSIDKPERPRAVRAGPTDNTALIVFHRDAPK
jgi:RNA polymerase sigma factor (sigma-70 family)